MFFGDVQPYFRLYRLREIETEREKEGEICEHKILFIGVERKGP